MKQKIEIIMLLLVLTALIFSSAMPAMQNHEADFSEHEDCVVYLLTTLLVTILSALLLFITTLTIELRHVSTTFSQYVVINKDDMPPRAPPKAF